MKILLEHDETPGRVYEEHLIYGGNDSCLNEMVNLNEAADYSIKTIKFRGKLQEHSTCNKNRRIYPFEVLDANVKKLQETIDAGGLIGECLIDPNFEVLTKEGWKPFKSIRVNDIIYSRINGKMIESKVENIIDKPYDGKAYQVKGKSIDCTFTANHKFLLENNKEQYYVNLEGIHQNRKEHANSKIPKTATWDGITSKIIKISNLAVNTDSLLAFIGLYLSRGYCSKKSKKVFIAQNRNKHLIKNLLKDLSPEIEWKECRKGFFANDERLHDYVYPLGNKYNKYIPSELKTSSSKSLSDMLAGFIVGNDNCLFNGKLSETTLFLESKQLADDVHECFIKCGRSCTVKLEGVYCLNISTSKFISLDVKNLKTIETRHQGRMYCLKTEYGNFFMKYKGYSFWTGNCDHANDSIVHFANASHLFKKLWWEGNKLMGEGIILNTPAGKIIRSLMESGARIGMSSRGVGNGKVNENGILVIGESYKLITFDAVADPSTYAAFQEKVTSKKEHTIPVEEINYSNKKNESSSIYTFDKELLLACLGGIVAKKSNELKARIR